MNYMKFLDSIGFLEFKKWNYLEIEHAEPKSNDEQKQIESKIKNKIGVNENGIYLYMKENDLLYIGKGKPIWHRIKSHYRESFSKVPGDTNNFLWHRFFSENNGIVKVYWKFLEEEEDRQIIEKMLIKTFKPKFEKFRKH